MILLHAHMILFQSCKKSKEELELMEKNVEEGDKTEIHENIQFYLDNIKGITNELDMLKGRFKLDNTNIALVNVTR